MGRHFNVTPECSGFALTISQFGLQTAAIGPSQRTGPESIFLWARHRCRTRIRRWRGGRDPRVTWL